MKKVSYFQVVGILAIISITLYCIGFVMQVMCFVQVSTDITKRAEKSEENQEYIISLMNESQKLDNMVMSIIGDNNPEDTIKEFQKCYNEFKKKGAGIKEKFSGLHSTDKAGIHFQSVVEKGDEILNGLYDKEPLSGDKIAEYMEASKFYMASLISLHEENNSKARAEYKKMDKIWKKRKRLLALFGVMFIFVLSASSFIFKREYERKIRGE